MTSTSAIERNQELLRLLVSMGTTREEIAKTIRKKGISIDRGRRGNPWCCPIALYLKGKGFSFVTVGFFVACTHEGTEERVRLPRAVHEFIKAFDSGREI